MVKCTRSGLSGIFFVLCSAAFAESPRHNAILFVPDGLRAAIVNGETAPSMAALRDEGTNFVNSHSLFPTFTTANASAFATGHLLGDTGDFSNTIDVGLPIKAAGGSRTPFLESDSVLQEIDANEKYAGNYLNEESILAAARTAGYSTAAIGKVGPVAIQDLLAMSAGATVTLDDSTGRDGGLTLPAEWAEALRAAGLSAEASGRGDNGKGGDAKTPGTWIPNLAQQQYFLEITLRVILPHFKAANRPFMLVYWSRDPDGTQHNQGDSIDALVPGINGPSSLSAIRTADAALAAIRQSLKALHLDANTDVVVAADHGFSTISKMSKTSAAAKRHYKDVVEGELPPGFLAIDLVESLGGTDASLALFDPSDKNASVDWRNGMHPKGGSGLIGHDPSSPDVIVAANGGSDLVYLPTSEARMLAPRVVQALLMQDYVSGVFIDDALGEIPGALPMSAIGLKGSALTPTPAIVVNFASHSTGCRMAVLCSAEVADSTLQQGQGMHGSFSRADTWNFMAATGPDFRHRYKDTMPASNADIGMTLAHLLGLEIPAKGQLIGRVLDESFVGGKTSTVVRRSLASKPSANGLKTVVKQQLVGHIVYSDAAGFQGRTVGLER